MRQPTSDELYLFVQVTHRTGSNVVERTGFSVRAGSRLTITWPGQTLTIKHREKTCSRCKRTYVGETCPRHLVLDMPAHVPDTGGGGQ